jgi:mono/diheme cytochrome c family protein
VEESNNVPIPNLGLSAREVDDLLAYLAARDGAAAGGPAAAPQPAPAPLAAAPVGDAWQGERLFTGEARLQAGGTPCIACHSVEGVAALGPDLTQVHTRYGGNQGLAATLSGLPFPSMQSIYANRPLTPAEQADLLAFFAALLERIVTAEEVREAKAYAREATADGFVVATSVAHMIISSEGGRCPRTTCSSSTMRPTATSAPTTRCAWR